MNGNAQAKHIDSDRLIHIKRPFSIKINKNKHYIQISVGTFSYFILLFRLIRFSEKPGQINSCLTVQIFNLANYCWIGRYLMFYAQSTAEGHIGAKHKTKCNPTTSENCDLLFNTHKFHHWGLKKFRENEAEWAQKAATRLA